MSVWSHFRCKLTQLFFFSSSANGSQKSGCFSLPENQSHFIEVFFLEDWPHNFLNNTILTALKTYIHLFSFKSFNFYFNSEIGNILK